MGQGLEIPRLVTAGGEAVGGVKHVFSVLLLLLYIRHILL